VDDLLDVSRISRGKIELRRERIDLTSVISDAVEAARPSCEDGGVDLKVSVPENAVYVDGDPDRLVQVIGNLLNNSCKFTEKDGSISIMLDNEGGNAVVRVKDTGIGLSPKQIPHIFDMFVQADTSLERTVSGLGIGLTLVKNLVQMHGGTVEVHSGGLGKGSEFVVRLPLQPETHAAPQAEQPAPEQPDGARRRILVVDDNVDSAESLGMLLRIMGHDIELAFDGLEAVEKAREFSPEVVLLDIGLPILNGFEAAREIRRHPWGKNMLLIALTGWGQEEDRRNSKDAGFDSHMVKPVDHMALIKQLDELTEPE
jgi:CheY-like chemotaxis protein/two-component sensor histidine kinase